MSIVDGLVCMAKKDGVEDTFHFLGRLQEQFSPKGYGWVLTQLLPIADPIERKAIRTLRRMGWPHTRISASQSLINNRLRKAADQIAELIS